MEKSTVAIYYFLFLVLFLFAFIKYRLYKLDHKSLLQQPLFWAAIALPLLTCFFLGSLIWIDKIQSFSLTSHGYERFLEISKLPLLILAASVPLVSIVNNLHRTIQTEKQILEAERKNRVDLYYNHMKFHLDLYNNIEAKKVISYYPIEIGQEEIAYQLYIKHPQQLYRKTYPLSTPDDSQYFNASNDFIIELHKHWVEINNSLKKLSESNKQLNPPPDHCIAKMSIFYEIISIYEKTCRHLCLGGYHTENSFVLNDSYDNYQIYSPFYDFRSLYQSLQSLEEFTYAFLDTCRYAEVDLYFPLEDKILVYGEGVLEDWFKYAKFLIPSSYQPAKMSLLPRLRRG